MKREVGLVDVHPMPASLWQVFRGAGVICHARNTSGPMQGCVVMHTVPKKLVSLVDYYKSNIDECDDAVRVCMELGMTSGDILAMLRDKAGC